MEIDQVPDEQTHKKGRHRKKQLYNSILQQMEFYFSDSNLTKDRFLSQLIQTDPFVELALFLTFNKIRKLTTSVDEITKAVGKSQLIELSEDKTKVRRKVPVKIKDNVDECTIYVERLKSDATHDWLTSIFSEFGNVVYVSIPKYKHNGIIKGFAFVEFENEEGAKTAVQYFESIDCKIPSFMEPQKLCSIATYEGEGKNDRDGIADVAMDRSENEEQKTNEDETEKTQNGVEKSENMQEEITSTSASKEEKKRKRSNTETNEDTQQATTSKNEERSKKKRKHCEIETDECGQQETKKNKKDDQLETNEDKTNEIEIKENLQEEAMSGGEGEEKKKKKHKKAHRKKINLKEIGLQILSKKDWKKMRNRYLDMQRKTMKQLKMHLNRQRFSNRHDANKKHRNEEMQTNHENDNKEKAHTQFVPGIIVKVSLTEPCEDNKKLKNEIKACSSEIKYVDIPLPVRCEEIYIRFSDNKNAHTFCASNFNKGKSRILEGTEEKEYWTKIETARQAKQKSSAGKQRGRDKLLKKAERQVAKHVRFGDDSE